MDTPLRTSEYDVAEHLRTPEDRAAYVEACMNDAPEDAAFIAKALGDAARATGLELVAQHAGLSPAFLRQALSGAQVPDFSVILKVSRALGLRLRVTVARD